MDGVAVASREGVWLWTQQLCHCTEALPCLGGRALLPPRPQLWSPGALREWPGLLPFPRTDVPRGTVISPDSRCWVHLRYLALCSVVS